jgi:hypothetical protein
MRIFNDPNLPRITSLGLLDFSAGGNILEFSLLEGLLIADAGFSQA